MDKSSFIFLIVCGGFVVLAFFLRDTSGEGNISGEAGGSKLAKQAGGGKPGEQQGGASGLMGAATEVDIESQVPLSGEAEGETCHPIEKEEFDKATQCVLDKIEKWVNPTTGEAKITDPVIGKDGKTYEKGKVPPGAEPAFSNLIIRQIIDSFPNSKMDKSVPEQSCPISLCPFSTPVVASDGHTYDLNALRRIPANPQGRVVSPMTRKVLVPRVYHNLDLVELIECAEEAGDFGSQSAGDEGPIFTLSNGEVGRSRSVSSEAAGLEVERFLVRESAENQRYCMALGLACLGVVAGFASGGGDSGTFACGTAGYVLGQVFGSIRGASRLRQLDRPPEGRP